MVGSDGGIDQRLILIWEIPANALLADKFLDHCEGFSIGSNDLTQLTLGVDRDSGLLTQFDERNEALKLAMGMAIAACRRQNKADLVHGHSSHHPTGVETYRDRLIGYGCGDFINDYEGISGYEHLRSPLSLAYLLSMAQDGSMRKLDIVPFHIERLIGLALDK